jgi:hypothetical protein
MRKCKGGNWVIQNARMELSAVLCLDEYKVMSPESLESAAT